MPQHSAPITTARGEAAARPIRDGTDSAALGGVQPYHRDVGDIEALARGSLIWKADDAALTLVVGVGVTARCRMAGIVVEGPAAGRIGQMVHPLVQRGTHSASAELTTNRMRQRAIRIEDRLDVPEHVEALDVAAPAGATLGVSGAHARGCPGKHGAAAGVGGDPGAERERRRIDRDDRYIRPRSLVGAFGRADQHALAAA